MCDAYVAGRAPAPRLTLRRVPRSPGPPCRHDPSLDGPRRPQTAACAPRRLPAVSMLPHRWPASHVPPTAHTQAFLRVMRPCVMIRASAVGATPSVRLVESGRDGVTGDAVAGAAALENHHHPAPRHGRSGRIVVPQTVADVRGCPSTTRRLVQTLPCRPERFACRPRPTSSRPQARSAGASEGRDRASEVEMAVSRGPRE